MSLGAFTQLGITHASSVEDIKAAYKILAKEHHPDRGGTKEGFIEINNIYERLIEERTNKGKTVRERFAEDLTPRVSVLRWFVDKRGNGVLQLETHLMIGAMTRGRLGGRYKWELFSSRAGCLEILKRDLARCNYKVTISFLAMNLEEITKTYAFEDNRSWWRKKMDAMLYSII